MVGGGLKLKGMAGKKKKRKKEKKAKKEMAEALLDGRTVRAPQAAAAGVSADLHTPQGVAGAAAEVEDTRTEMEKKFDRVQAERVRPAAIGALGAPGSTRPRECRRRRASQSRRSRPTRRRWTS